MKKKYLIILILIFSTTILKGQRFGNIHFCDKWYAKANIGITMQWGDIQDNWEGHLRIRPAYEIGLGKELNTFLSIETNFLTGNIEGYKSSYDKYFKADIFEYNLSGIIDITTLSAGFNSHRMLKIHGVLGIGFYNYNSILKTISTDNILSTIGYDVNDIKVEKKTELILKAGFNLTVNLSEKMSLILDNTWSFTGSDYLDAYKGGFAYDIYSFTSIGIAYKFNFRKNGNSLDNYRIRY
ncbi:MAG: hypothetical protein NTZ33_12800 [Bacteroidetes bacterium]|nr:hypothetical protein [Bacteroidota bacterium]